MRAALIVLCLALSPAVALAQAVSALALEIGRLARASDSDPDLIADLRDNLWKEIYLSSGQAEVAEILTFRRADIQTGAGSGASGTTSAVVDPLLPAIFGVALENGAITRTVSGTTITLKIAPAGLVCASRPQAAAAVARRDTEACRTFWRRIGLTASFDTKRGEKSAELDNLQTLDGQFSDLAVRAEVLNRRTATGSRYVSTFQNEFEAWKQQATAFAGIDRRTNDVLQAEVLLEERLTALIKKPEWRTKTPDKRADDISALIRDVVGPVVLPDGPATEVRNAWLAALRADRALQNAVANAPVVTVEYAFQRPDVATEANGALVPEGTRPPNVHTARAIYAQGLGKTSLDFTANVSVSWFDDVRPGMSGRFRDVRAGIEGKFRLRDLANYGAPALTFAGLYVFLNQEPLGLGIVGLNGAPIDEPGHIAVFQTKLEIPAGNNAMRIPLSLTYSNRTELVNESDVRGQIGISFNLDALFVEKKQAR